MHVYCIPMYMYTVLSCVAFLFLFIYVDNLIWIDLLID